MASDQPRPSRASLNVKVVRLDAASSDDLSSCTTPVERLEMVAVLSARMWELTGRSAPAYSRETMPVRVVRRS